MGLGPALVRDASRIIGRWSREQGCYIATAVYGSYDCPEVWTLRRFRDFYLRKTWFGRVFVKIYYSASPLIVKIFGHNITFKSFCRKKLDKLVDKLNSRGISNSPYSDKK